MLGDRKARALQIVIERIIALHNVGRTHLGEEVFKEFELAKRIGRAETEEEFRAAIAELGVELPQAPDSIEYPLLSFVTTIRAPGAKRFVAADAFGPNNPAGIKFFLGDNFRKFFLGKTEENVEPATIAIHRLKKSSRDPDIMAELGPEKRVIQLAHFYELIKAQANGQKGPLLVSGWATFACIPDENGNLWAVRAYWDSLYREWDVNADSDENPLARRAGRRVLSRK